MSRDSLYQQVRSHLAYLNLGAAAEALPTQLDQALQAKATHTEFLEQLLRVEVDATQARRHAGRLRFANFPAPWRIEDFDFDAQPSVYPALMRELATCRDPTHGLPAGVWGGRVLHRLPGAPEIYRRPARHLHGRPPNAIGTVLPRWLPSAGSRTRSGQ